MEREIEHKKNSPNNAIARRARQIDKLLNNRDLVRRFFPRPPVDYHALGLDKENPDDRILGELVTFIEINKDAKVYFVSDDGALRRAAADLDLHVIEPPSLLRSRSKDPLTRENERLKQRISELESGHPKLRLVTEQQSYTVGEPLADSTFESAAQQDLDKVAPPEGNAFHGLPEEIRFFFELGDANPDYDRSRLQYCARLARFLKENYKRDKRTVIVRFELVNDGEARDTDVDVTVTIPRGFSVFDDVPETLERPRVPRSHQIVGIIGKQVYDPDKPDLLESSLASLKVQTADRLRITFNGPTLSEGQGEAVLARFVVRKIAQHDRSLLEPLYIELPDKSLKGLKLTYEIRSSVRGVTYGELNIRLRVEPARRTSTEGRD